MSQRKTLTKSKNRKEHAITIRLKINLWKFMIIVIVEQQYTTFVYMLKLSLHKRSYLIDMMRL